MNSKMIYRIINIICLITLVGTVVWLMIIWDKIPDEIPMHYNYAGEADRMGSKSDIIILPIFSWLLYGIMAFVELIPGAWNTGVKVTAENSQRVYAIIRRMLVVIKVSMVFLFTMITIFSVNGKNMPVWFTLVTCVAIFGTIIYSLISLYKNQ